MQERQEMEKLCAEVDWIEGIHWRVNPESSLLEVDLDLAVHGNPRAVTLTYPEAFPNTPAYIRPRDKAQHWSVHQYGAGGSLCLEWRADNWQRSVTGADLVRSLYKLLSTESHPDQPARVPSAHHLTSGQEMRSNNNRLIASPGLFTALSLLPSETVVPIRSNTVVHDSTFVCFVSEIADTAGDVFPIGDLPKALSAKFPLFTWAREGFALKSGRFSDTASVNTVDELASIIAEAGLSVPVTAPGGTGLARLPDAIFLLAGDDAVNLQAFYVINGELTRYVVIRAEDPGLRLPPAYTELKEMRIAIIGLGSIGSKIAMSLARSGCRKFLVVDDDLLLPQNTCRHELSWMAVGVHKAAAIKEALSYVAAGIEVDGQIHRLAGQESSMIAARVLKRLASCDLIIDATANPDVFLLLAAVAQTHHLPLCWGEVYAGGIGGMIARARPGADPNPLAVRDGVTRYLQDQPPAPYRNATGYDVSDEDPIVADDADVSHIASAIARLALDTLVKRQPSAFGCQAYLIGLRNEWVFSSAFDTRPIEVTGEGWDLPQSSEDEMKAALETLVSIMTEGADDRSDSAAGDPQNDQGSAAQSR